jgi:hypothetical protein
MPTLADILKLVSGEPKMHERFGEFICNYAKVEQTLHLTFDGLCGLHRRVARAMMGNARIADLQSVLTRIVDMHPTLKPEAKADYHLCIDQLNKITTLITSTNELIAKSAEAVEILTLHIDDLAAAAHDCSSINIRLMLILRGDLKSQFDADAQAALYEPWRYKPVQPSRPYQPLAKAQPAAEPRKN